MKGEPPAAALAEARLVATTCEAVKTEEIDARLREMRAAVDASFKEWHASQPDCWAADRAEHVARRSGDPGVLSGEHASRSAWGYGLGGVGTIGHGAGTAAGAPATKAPPAKAARASGTNNQIASVDEADLVKNDGRYVYIAANGALRIIEAMNPRVVSVTPLPGYARELFIEGDRAVVYASSHPTSPRCTYGYDCQFAGDGTATSVIVVDVARRDAPTIVRQLDLSGSLVAARRIGKTIHTVVADNDAPGPGYVTWPADLDTCGAMENVVRQKFAKLKADNERTLRARSMGFPTLTERGQKRALCDGLLRTAIRDGQAFTSIVSFDLSDDASPPATATVQSRPGAVFASRDALYMSVVHRKSNGGGRWYSSHSSSDEVSEIHKFRIGESSRATRYVGSGVVPGHVLNQLAMDEYYGYLRVATTKGRVPDPKVASVVSILTEAEGGNLVRVGAIDDIAPGEDIRAVRFDDDRGYVVTFKKTDPLFVLDLYQPARPAILGELKIPGFSTYMHRIDPDHLLSIGFDADDRGSFAYFDGVILQLFDVKNPTRPTLVHKEKIGTRGSSSQAATDHLAFNYFASEGLLAVPMTICEGGGDGANGDRLAFSGLLVYDVDVERGFTRLGGVDHGTKGVSCGTWWSHATSAVKRSIFLDDLVYSIATDRLKVQRMSRFGVDLADLSLR
ncbi:MAG: beta-propeller domain-containing protein [Labilithrix sp.]|nr:beta-propeller domain-containing protein [Labilithrix sp.]